MHDNGVSATSFPNCKYCSYCEDPGKWYTNIFVALEPNCCQINCWLWSKLTLDQKGDEESIETDEDETHIPAESEIAAVCVVEVVCVVTVEAPMSITNW